MTDVQHAGSTPEPSREGGSVDEARVAVVVEDEADIRSLLDAVLEQAGFTVFTASNGLDGIEQVRRHDPLVTTLDVNMPGIDGYETARRIREFSATYIMMVTARTEEVDALQGLEAGADDYVTKPFRPRELRARVEAMLRRRELDAATAAPPADGAVDTTSEWLEHRGIRLHSAMRIVTLDGAELDLTRSEFDILADLLGSERRVLSKSHLALMLRGESYGADDLADESDSRAIEVHMANLRRKLGESPSEPKWIETIRGVGYRLTAR